jgi:hypothetical protein
MRRRKVADWALEHELGVDEGGLLRLALSPRPRPDHADDDIALLVAATGCEEAALRLILDGDQALSEVAAASAPSVDDTADEQLPF